MKISQIRVARPTDKLADVVRFYRDGLGFQVIFRFENHDGYDGVMLAFPGRLDHLEFISRGERSACLAPSDDNLLVLYVPEPGDFAAMAERLDEFGQAPVEPENPYWAQSGALTFADPDGWRVVLFPGARMVAPASVAPDVLS